MSRTIAIIGTLDTKGDQVEYLKNKIQVKDHKALVIDVGVLGDPGCPADITRQQVAEAANTTIDAVIEMGGVGNETKSIGKMGDGVCRLLKEMDQQGELDALLAVGGSMGTSLAIRAIEVLPFQMPKVILSTIANSPAIDPDVYAHNVMMIPWVGGLWGINEISKMILNQAAGVIVGAAEAYEKGSFSEKRMIGVVSLGMSGARFLFHLRPALEKKGYDIATFHATGMGSRLLEKAVEEGYIDAVLELCAGFELVNEEYSSVFGPGPHKLEAAIKRGIPMIVSLGSMEITSWGPIKPIPEKLQGRPQFEHNPLLIGILTTLEERLTAAKKLAEKLNRTTGPTALIIPLIPPYGQTKYGLADPEGMEAVRKELRKNLDPKVKVFEIDSSEEDPKFTSKVMELLEEMIQ